MRPAVVIAGLLCLFAPAASAYIRGRSFAGAFLRRNDFAGVQFSLNDGAVPGLLNADGKLIITPDSDVMGAVQAAMATWNAVPTSAARFLPPEITTALNNPNDRRHTIVIADSPAIRSLVGPSLTSQTLLATNALGTILDSDIVLNPVLTFSTTGAPGTFDLQSVLTKALGNSLGANNSAVLGAALCFSTAPNSTVQQTLSPEDVTFVSAVYPASDASPFATIGGTLTLNGSPLRNALISLVDPSEGTALSALTSYADGTWSTAVPPGSYQIYAQPLTGPVLPYLLAINDSQPIDTAFQSGFMGGNGSATTIAAAAGDLVTADFSPAPASDGVAPVLYAVSAVAPGAAAGINTVYPLGFSGAISIASGRTMDFALLGPGIDSTLSDANILLMGPLNLAPGSVRADHASFSVNGVAYPVMRFTANIDPVSAQSYGTIVILSNGGGIASYTGGVVLLPQR
jgi:hypothetical protein